MTTGTKNTGSGCLGILPNFAQNVNPMGMVPYLRDLLSILQGYDVERMDLAAVTGLVQAARGCKSAERRGAVHRNRSRGQNLVAELSRAVGLPVPTVKRDVLAIARSMGIETGDWYFQYQIERAINSLGYSGNRKEFYDIAFGALICRRAGRVPADHRRYDGRRRKGQAPSKRLCGTGWRRPRQRTQLSRSPTGEGPDWNLRNDMDTKKRPKPVSSGRPGPCGVCPI